MCCDGRSGAFPKPILSGAGREIRPAPPSCIVQLRSKSQPRVIIVTETGDCNRSTAQFARMIFGKTSRAVPSWNTSRIHALCAAFQRRFFPLSHVAVSCFLRVTCLVNKFDVWRTGFSRREHLNGQKRSRPTRRTSLRRRSKRAEGVEKTRFEFHGLADLKDKKSVNIRPNPWLPFYFSATLAFTRSSSRSTLIPNPRRVKIARISRLIPSMVECTYFSFSSFAISISRRTSSVPSP